MWAEGVGLGGWKTVAALCIRKHAWRIKFSIANHHEVKINQCGL